MQAVQGGAVQCTAVQECSAVRGAMANILNANEDLAKRRSVRMHYGLCQQCEFTILNQARMRGTNKKVTIAAIYNKLPNSFASSTPGMRWYKVPRKF